MENKAVILLTHHPDPRMVRRIRSLSALFENILLVFWDRSFDTPIPKGVQSIGFKYPDPWGILARVLVDLKLFFASVRILLKQKPNLVYISGFDMLLAGCLYKFMHPDAKIILEVADLPGGRFAKQKYMKFLNIFANYMVNKVDFLVLTSPYFWEGHYKHIFHYPEKVFIFENFPQKALFNKFKTVEHDKLTIGFVGSVRYSKQIKMLFDACKQFEDKVRIIVAGSGPDYEYIKEISKEYANVEVTGPYNYGRDILNIYSKIDIVYSVYDASLPNVKVAIPNRLYESIVCALPIIVAKETALGDFVRKNDIGFEVSHVDRSELSCLIERIINNHVILHEKRKNAVKIRDNFFYENVEKEFLNKIKQMIETQ